MADTTRNGIIAVALAALIGGGFIFIIGCETDSAETIIREVGLNVTGLYANRGSTTTTSGTEVTEGNLVADNSGNPITQLNLRQYGDQLEAVDNNGIIFKGTIGNVSDDTASITLEGQTTAGQPATISAIITVPVGSSDATMQGTWIEPSRYSTVYGKATVPENAETPSNNTSNPPNTNVLMRMQLNPDGSPRFVVGVISFWSPPA
jgi:hypothetical protein